MVEGSSFTNIQSDFIATERLLFVPDILQQKKLKKKKKKKKPKK